MLKTAAQGTKFLIPAAVILAIDWWLDNFDTGTDVRLISLSDYVCQYMWILLAILLASGIVNMCSYWIIANYRLFNSLSIKTIVLLTLATSSIATADMINWRVLDYLSNPGWVWLVYYPVLSLLTVFGRYWWLRHRGRLGAAPTVGPALHPTASFTQRDRTNR